VTGAGAAAHATCITSHSASEMAGGLAIDYGRNILRL